MALLLLCVSVCFCLASGTFLDFKLDTVDPNELILECYDSETGTIDSGATISFFFPGESAPHMISPTGTGNTGLPHTVTPANEALLRCTASDESGMSDQVAIAAVPASYSAILQVDKAVFNGNTGELTCPIMLGDLHTVLDPYHISWEQIEDGVFPIPVNDSDLLSNDDTILSIPIDDSTASNVYRCVLNLRRCNIAYPSSDGNNTNYKCQSEEYNGPRMGFAVFEKLRVIENPIRQDVLFSETASFNCTGYGSFLSITWKLMSDSLSGVIIYCNRDSCNHTALSHHEFTSDKFIIRSALMVDTSQLHALNATYTVQCILQQTVPVNVSLVGTDDQTFTANLFSTLPSGHPVVVSHQHLINEVELQCIVTGTPLPTVTWFKDNERLNSTSTDSINVSSMSYESDNLTTSIKINMPTQDNNGVYICVATNEVGSMNKTFHIETSAISSLSTDDVSGNTLNGDLIITPTNVTLGVPEANITWLHSSSIVPLSHDADNRVEMSNEGVLTIRGVQAGDRGTYTVRASNGVGADAKASVDVTIEFVDLDGPFISIEKNVAMVTCRATGYPIPIITWSPSPSSNSSFTVNRTDFDVIVEGTSVYTSCDSEVTYRCSAGGFSIQGNTTDCDVKGEHYVDIILPLLAIVLALVIIISLILISHRVIKKRALRNLLPIYEEIDMYAVCDRKIDTEVGTLCEPIKDDVMLTEMHNSEDEVASQACEQQQPKLDTGSGTCGPEITLREDAGYERVPHADIGQILRQAAGYKNIHLLNSSVGTEDHRYNLSGDFDRHTHYERVPMVDIAQILSCHSATTAQHTSTATPMTPCSALDLDPYEQIPLYEQSRNSEILSDTLQAGESTASTHPGSLSNDECFHLYERVQYSESVQRMIHRLLRREVPTTDHGLITPDENVPLYERVKYSETVQQMIINMLQRSELPTTHTH